MAVIVDQEGNIIFRLVLDRSDYDQMMKGAVQVTKDAAGKMSDELKSSADAAAQGYKNLADTIQNEMQRALNFLQLYYETNINNSNEATRLLEMDAREAARFYEQQATQTANHIISESRKTNEVVRDHVEKTERSFYDRFVRVAVGFSLVYRAMQLVTRGFRMLITEAYKTLEVIDDFNKQVIATAATLINFSKVKNPLEMYQRVLPEIRGMMSDLEIASAKSILTFEQLREVYTSFAKKGVLGITDKDVQNMITVGEVIKLISPNAEQIHTYMREIYNIIEGTTGRGKAVAKYIYDLIPGLKENVKLWRQMGTDIEGNNILLKNLSEHLTGIRAAQGDLANLWQTTKDNLVTYWHVIQRSAGQELYKQINQDLQDIGNQLFINGQQTTQVQVTIADWAAFLEIIYLTLKMITRSMSELEGSGELLLALMLGTAHAAVYLREAFEVILITLDEIFLFAVRLLSLQWGDIFTSSRILDRWKETVHEALTDLERLSHYTDLSFFDQDTSKNRDVLKQLAQFVQTMNEGSIKTKEQEQAIKHLADAMKKLSEETKIYQNIIKEYAAGTIKSEYFKFFSEWPKEVINVESWDQAQEYMKKFWEHLKAKQKVDDIKDLEKRIEDFKEKIKDLTIETKVFDEAWLELLEGRIDLEQVSDFTSLMTELAKNKDIPKEILDEFKRKTIEKFAIEDAINRLIEKMKEAKKASEDYAKWIPEQQKEEEQKFLDDINKLLEKQNDDLRKAIDLRGQLTGKITETEEYQKYLKTLRDIAELEIGSEMKIELNRLAREEYFKEMSDIAEKAFEKMQKELDKVKTLGEEVSESLMKSFGTGLFDLAKGEFHSFKDFVRIFGDDLLKVVSNYMAEIAQMHLFEPALRKLGLTVPSAKFEFIPPVLESSALPPAFFEYPGIGYHQGGVVSRALRMHSGGLMSDEIPAILQTGETVLPRGISPVQKTYNINVPINAIDAKSFADLISRNKKAFMMPIIDALEQGDSLLMNRLQRSK